VPGPSTPPAFDASHAPAVRGRNRASSISFDLNPFKRLQRALEDDHAHALESADEHAYGLVADDEAGPDDGSSPWRQGFDKEEVRRALGELLFHVEGLVRAPLSARLPDCSCPLTMADISPSQTTRLHAALSRQLETEHELKIARTSWRLGCFPVVPDHAFLVLPGSNLMLTEANVEMLEESIRRGGQFGCVRLRPLEPCGVLLALIPQKYEQPSHDAADATQGWPAATSGDPDVKHPRRALVSGTALAPAA
jgi:hypothetical protein